MKKKIIAFVCVLFSFISIICFSAYKNVYAYQSENENELSNITNYWDLDNISISSNYTDYQNYFSIEDNLATITGYGLISASRKIFFDLSYLDNDNYIILCFNDFNQANSTTTNDTTYLGVASSVNTGARSYFGSNIIYYKFTKSDTNKYLNFGINYFTYTNQAPIHFKFYLYKSSDFFNTSNNIMYDSIYDFMFDSNINEYIDKTLYTSLLQQYNDLIGSTSLYLTPFDESNVSSIVYYTNNELNDYEPIGLLGNYFVYDNHFLPDNIISYQIIITFNQLMPSNNFYMKPTDNNIYNVSAYVDNNLISSNVVRYNENYETGDYDFSIGNFNKLIISVQVVNYSVGNWQLQVANDYNSGYQNGYNAGYSSATIERDGYWSTLYNQLQSKYNKLANEGFNLVDMVWAIATIPFESFKQIWNVEILGLNIANFTIGLLFCGVIIWLIKKYL